MREFEEKVYNFINENNLIDAGDSVLVGLSGGADSTCLLSVLFALAEKLQIKKIAALHVNHGIRGEEAFADAEFAKNLCETMGVEFYLREADIPAMAKKLGMSEEEAGRKYRYDMFNETAETDGFTKIAVAHNENDLAETFIFNMVRGTGLAGITGIDVKREKIIRPLLSSTRAEIEAYLRETGQDFVNDSTNSELIYSRNKTRHIIMPAMQEINEQAISHISELANENKKIDDYISRKVDEAYHDIVAEEDSQIVIDVAKAMLLDEVILTRLVHNAIANAAKRRKDIGRKHIQSVCDLICGETGKRVELPYSVVARKNYDKVIIGCKTEKKLGDTDANKTEIGNENRIINVELTSAANVTWQQLHNMASGTGKFEAKECYNIENGILKFGICDLSGDVDTVGAVDIEKSLYTKMLDYDKIRGGLCIRKPLKDDYIVIDSKGSRKKLSRVFIDSKVDREKRDNWPVVASGDEVLWAVGLRYNEAYRIGENTKKTLVITYEER